jgi:hypothetical protein
MTQDHKDFRARSSAWICSLATSTRGRRPQIPIRAPRSLPCAGRDTAQTRSRLRPARYRSERAETPAQPFGICGWQAFDPERLPQTARHMIGDSRASCAQIHEP